MDIKNKRQRMVLLGKYLGADTTLAEERMLQEYFRTHEPEEDERPYACLLGLSALPRSFPEPNQSGMAWTHGFSNAEIARLDEGVSEYDRLLKSRRRPKALIRLTAATLSLAAGILLAIMLWPSGPSCEIGPVEITRCMTALSELEPGEIVKMKARPAGEGVVIKVLFKDGTESDWVLVRSGEDDSLQLLAINKE